MPFLWWLIIVAAIVLVLSYAFGRSPRRVGAPAGRDYRQPEPLDLSTDARFMDQGHADAGKGLPGRQGDHAAEFAAEVSPFATDGAARVRRAAAGGPAKVQEEPELFPDRTGATTALALGAREKPFDQQRDQPGNPAAAGDYGPSGGGHGGRGLPAHAALVQDAPERPYNPVNPVAGPLDANEALGTGPAGGASPAAVTPGQAAGAAGTGAAGQEAGAALGGESLDAGTRGWAEARSFLGAGPEGAGPADTGAPRPAAMVEDGTYAFGARPDPVAPATTGGTGARGKQE